ncbi:MAG: fasciclin domain-containing protein [Candidatus Cyclobacteriaceae bacterium M3_2C_046]
MKFLLFNFIVLLVVCFGCNRPGGENSSENYDFSTSTETEGVPGAEEMKVGELSDYSNLDVSIFNILDSIPQLASFNAALENTGLGQELDTAKSQFIIFAPSNNAFEEFFQEFGSLAQPSNADQLQQVLSNHVVSLFSNSYDMKDEMNYNSVGGRNLVINIENEMIQVNNSEIIERNIRGENGIIHIVNQVITPRSQ